MIGSSKKLLMGAAGSGGGDPSWILRYDPSFTNTYGVMSGVRSGDGTDDGNLFWAVGGADTSSDGSIIVKMNKDGDILLDKRINNSSVQTFKPKIEVDSSDNVFFSHLVGGNNLIVKLNSSLAVQSQQRYSASYSGSQPAMTIYNDDIYIASTHNDFYPSARPLGYVVDGANMNVSGTPYSFLGIDAQPQRCVHVDGSGNIYMTNGVRDSSGGDTPCVIKWGTDWSSEVWVRKFTGLGLSVTGYGQDLTVDSSGNVYNCGHLNIAYPNRRDNYVAKFNSSGTVQWMKSLNMPNGDANTYMLGNLAMYAIHHTSQGIVTLSYGKSNVQSGNFDINVSLWNTSNGSLISSYGIANTSSDWNLYNQTGEHDTKTLITEENVYITAIDSGQRVYIMKLPITDSSGIYGTYSLNGQNIKIAANGFQDTDVSNTTWSSSSFSNTSRTITKTSQSGYGISDVSVTPTLVEI